MTDSDFNERDLTIVQRVQDEYIAGRLLAPDLSREEVAAALTALVEYFGIDWLQRSQSHPISKLWRSFDEISTQELFWLGDSIRVVSAIDDRWVRDAVRKIKLPDPSRSGTVFELLIMATLQRRAGNQDIRPCPPMTRGIDAYGSVANGTKVAISMKSFGASYKEKQFEKRAAVILNDVQGEAKRLHLDWFGFVSMLETYPTSSDWNSLENGLKAALLDRSSTTNWAIKRAAPPVQALSKQFPSFNFCVAAPRDPSEVKGVDDYIDAAARDLNRYAENLEDGTLPLLIVKLSDNADLAFYEQSASRYLASPGVRVAGILLIQISVSVQVERDTTSIVVSSAIAWRAGITPINLKMTFLSALFSKKGSHYAMVSPYGSVSLPPCHAFSKRQVHVIVNADAAALSRGVTGNGHSMPGAEVAPVFRFGDGSELKSGRRHPVPERFSMFD